MSAQDALERLYVNVRADYPFSVRDKELVESALDFSQQALTAEGEYRSMAERTIKSLEEQLEAAQARIAQLEQSWHDSASISTYTTSVSSPASEPEAS